jgi:hypothetical protein
MFTAVRVQFHSVGNIARGTNQQATLSENIKERTMTALRVIFLRTQNERRKGNPFAYLISQIT